MPRIETRRIVAPALAIRGRIAAYPDVVASIEMQPVDYRFVVQNVGNAAGTLYAALYLGGTKVGESVEYLGPGEARTTRMTVIIPRAGTYTLKLRVYAREGEWHDEADVRWEAMSVSSVVSVLAPPLLAVTLPMALLPRLISIFESVFAKA